MRRSAVRRWCRGLALAYFSLLAGIAAASSGNADLDKQVQHLPASQREALRKRQASLQRLDDAQRLQLRQRMQQWQQLSAAQRARRRDAWHAWQALPDIERQRISAAGQAFVTLSPAEQADLRKRFAELDDNEQRGWLLGPALGVNWHGLQPLVMQVPSEQREPLLALLRALSPEQARALTMLAQRTPPQQRDQLRRELMAVPAARREAWLRARLGE